MASPASRAEKRGFVPSRCPPDRRAGPEHDRRYRHLGFHPDPFI